MNMSSPIGKVLRGVFARKIENLTANLVSGSSDDQSVAV
jgi:hypothetical protein